MMANSRFLVPALTSLCLALLTFAEVDAARAGQFGTRCQQDYESGWQKTLPHTWDRCSRFNSELDDTDSKLFYFDLKGVGVGFTSSDGSVNTGGVDAGDLFYVGTHGGANNSTAVLTMFTKNLSMSSVNWRFGDNSDGVAIFSQYACRTLQIDDFTWTRWSPAFKGGLYVATGSHRKLWDSITTDEVGEDYADDLQDGKSVMWAWFDGNSDWYEDQDVAVLVTGSSLANCEDRRAHIKWQNFSDYTRLRDGAVNKMCYAAIYNN